MRRRMKPPLVKLGTRTVTRWSCTCQRCRHEWISEGTAPPKRCAACKSTYWQRAARWPRPDLRK